MSEKRPEISQITVKEFMENDPEAIELIVRTYSSPLFYFLYGLIGEKEIVEDLVQESFARAWRYRNKIDSTKNFKTWLFTIGRNGAIDFFRKRKDIAISKFDNNEDSNILEDTISDESIDILSVVDNKINLEIIEQTISKLPKEYAAVLNLRFKESFSFDEIAEILKKPSSTVRSQCRRALIQLRKDLPEFYGATKN